MVKQGPTVENINMIVDKAKGKPDGVYSFRSIIYKVRGGRFTHFAYSGEIYERAGNFNVRLGQYTGFDDGARKALKQL